jgi:aquaporin Z
MKRKGSKEDSIREQIPLSKRIVAEFIGTFVYVFTTTGAMVADSISGHTLGEMAVVAAPGLALVGMIYSAEKISGAYLILPFQLDLPSAAIFQNVIFFFISWFR